MRDFGAAVEPGADLTRLGASYLGEERCCFRVWAPQATTIDLELSDAVPRRVRLQPDRHGYWIATLDSVDPGTRYRYAIDGNRSYPDPASQSQPDGVHGDSEVVSHDFPWTDAGWHGRAVDDYVIYELHIGAFTAAGTFEAAVDRLARLRTLGITAIEVMPVAQFPGSRNWGYDGVYPFAVQHSYGGVRGFKRFVDAAHEAGLAVVLDVVYNHLGPEGNYLGQFGPYFTDRYQTPWGQAINFDGPDSAGVRNYFVQNALYWVREFHVDGLRLDAVHAIHDSSARHILTEIASAVHDFAKENERIITVIAESDLNEARIVRSGELGGYGLDAQWSDDFHHAVHAVLTGERAGYYEDFGDIDDVAKALSSGFVYSGQYSRHRRRCHGSDCGDVPGRAFVVCVQNHDQIGNRMLGERLGHITDIDALKTAAGLLLLSPFVPLLFMGQEYADTAPFLYFVSHSDESLIKAVREGRKREFAAFSWRREIPDAQDELTFFRSKLNPELANGGRHAVLLEWYRTLLAMRQAHPALAKPDRDMAAVDLTGSTLVLRRWRDDQEVVAVFHLSGIRSAPEISSRHRTWSKLLDSADVKWLGPGSRVPDHLEEREGKLCFELAPKQCVIFVCGPQG